MQITLLKGESADIGTDISPTRNRRFERRDWDHRLGALAQRRSIQDGHKQHAVIADPNHNPCPNQRTKRTCLPRARYVGGMGGFLARLFYSSIKIDRKRYWIVKKIGEGGFSFVYLVEDGRSRKFAVKKMLLQVSEQEEAANREIGYHEAIKHCPHVMKLLAHETKSSLLGNSEAFLLFPYYTKGNAQEAVERSIGNGIPVPEGRILAWVACLCDAVAAFHALDPPIAHRDVKPHNLLLTNDQLGVVLMDLGSASEARVVVRSRAEALAVQELCAQTCTAQYRAPELFEVPSECEITEKTDTWSVGCTMYALAYGTSPFDGSATSAGSGRVRFPDVIDGGGDVAFSYSADFIETIQWILKVDPKLRPSIAEVRDRVQRLVDQVGGEAVEDVQVTIEGKPMNPHDIPA